MSGVSVLAALVYGLALAGRPPSALRTGIKTAAVGALGVLAFLSGTPGLLAGALLLCAVGDAFLAGEPRRWLPAGLLAFLLGHGLYIFLFQQTRDPGIDASGPALAGMAVVGGASLAMLAWLWRSLGPLRPAVILYVVAIAVMVASSFLLPSVYWPAMAGAVLFMASDAILAIDLFRDEKLFGSPLATRWAVWFLYWGGQALILWSYLRQPF
ncbi:MAG: lysoplasmalogenase [Pseudomonadota bacterium]